LNDRSKLEVVKLDFSDVACLVPVFNEFEVVGGVVAELCRVFDLVVCIDDGSNDGSGEIARHAGAHVIRHCVNIGQGGALSTGFKFALSQPNIRYVVTFDGDGQHRVVDAVSLVKRLKSESLDVVLGTRFAGVEALSMPKSKRVILRLLIRIRRIFIQSEFTDIHNGLRAFTTEALNKFEVTQFGMAHASEINQKIRLHKLKVVEEPVQVIYTPYSISKGQTLLNGVNVIAELFWR
jgi:glycosyltransferase involved in cell wall biosynthesis